jgi:hypothetical protein
MAEFRNFEFDEDVALSDILSMPAQLSNNVASNCAIRLIEVKQGEQHAAQIGPHCGCTRSQWHS